MMKRTRRFAESKSIDGSTSPKAERRAIRQVLRKEDMKRDLQMKNTVDVEFKVKKVELVKETIEKVDRPRFALRNWDAIRMFQKRSLRNPEVVRPPKNRRRSSFMLSGWPT
jgi:hypothetical protein